MRKKTCVLIVIFIYLVLFCLMVDAKTYTTEDLWVVEVILNKTRSVNEEVIVDNDKILFPLRKLAGLLKITTVEKNNLITCKDRDIKIDIKEGQYIKTDRWKKITQIVKLKNQYYLPLTDLAAIFNLNTEYNNNRLTVFINGTVNHYQEKEDMAEEFKEKELPAFSWPFLNYDLETDFSDYSLDYSLRGRFLNGDYSINSSFDGEEHSLNNASLVYDFDGSSLNIMKNSTILYREENLNTKRITGIQIKSKNSPLQSKMSHLIDFQISAPADTEVILYVNGSRRKDGIVVKNSYTFKDVLLHNGYNEIKIVKKLPSGREVKDIKTLYLNSKLVDKRENRYNLVAGVDEDDRELKNISYSYGLTDNLTVNTNILDYRDKDMASAGIAYNYLDRSVISLDYLVDGNGKGYRIGFDNATRHTYSGITLTRYNNFRNKEHKNINGYFSGYTDNIYFNTNYNGDFNNASNHSLNSYLRWTTEKTRNRINLNYSLKEENNKSTVNNKNIGFRTSYELTDNLDTYTGISRDMVSKNNSYYLGIGYINERIGATGFNVSYQESKPEQVKTRLYWNKEYDRFNIINTLNINYDNGIYSYPYSLRLTHNIKPSLELTFSYNKNDDINTYSLSVDKDFINETELNIDASYGDDSNLKITAGLSGSLGIVDDEFVVGQSNLRTGIVKGVVYYDKNKNGIKDEDEHPVRGIPVILDNKIIYSGRSGQYKFTNIKPGHRKIGFATEKLEIKYSPTVYTKEVDVHKGEIKIINLGLTITGVVDGYIKIKGFEKLEDYQQKQFNLNNAKLEFSDKDYPVRIFNNGYYFIDDLQPGRYKIQINSSNLPDWIKVVQGEHEFKITDKGEYISNQDIILEVNK